MTNGEKYKTAQERAEAFHDYCESHDRCSFCELDDYDEPGCHFAWLDLEAAADKPLPCPFCGDETVVNETLSGEFTVICMRGGCFYRAGTHNTRTEAIAAHNRVAKAVMERKNNNG